jgi:DNA end-binding protein Ku
MSLRKLVKRKASGKTIEVREAAERPSNVIDLMDALQKSHGAKSQRKTKIKAKAKAKKQSHRRSKKSA